MKKEDSQSKTIQNGTNSSVLDHDWFREHGSEMVRYVADYLEDIGKRRVFPQIAPGYLAPLIPEHAPEEPEPWSDILKDIERVVMPGITHWQHPNFHAYFPVGNSYPSICADILTDGFACIGFSWASSPACTELEVVMMDWLARILQLPKHFLSGGQGGGVIQGSCSDATLVALFAARNKAIKHYQTAHPEASEYEAASKLVGYYSDQAHSSVERAGLISMLRLRPIQTGLSREMTGAALHEAIEQDVAKGLIPFFCTATLGTTASCAFDRLGEVGEVCDQYGIWLHVDAAYAGCSFICPEYRPLMNGIEHAMSFVFNPAKWMLVNFDCSCIWYKEVDWVIKSFSVDPVYLKHKHEGKVPDFRHWHIPLGRRFRSLKLWFVLRYYGVDKLRNYIRNHINLAHYFEELLLKDSNYEVVNKVKMGLVCFRIKDDNEHTKQLYQAIEDDGRIHLVPSEFHYPEEVFFIRFAVCYHSATKAQIEYALNVIRELTKKVLQKGKK
ncbi:unnamed protein product [Calicophoron daubneyi]|uniref:Aromatic-L-amino-acid decarboxylase n=1 Tax=Calicophoron daubneyi TaxID=300641 RepID=A0AAV2TGD6_CALDB